GLTGSDPVATIHTGNNVRLAALTNTQGSVAQRNSGQFLHVEVARHIREDELLYREAATVLGAIDSNTLSARSVPIVTRNRFIPSQIVTPVGLNQTIGDSQYASPSDHGHPWSNSDNTAGNNFIATRNSINSGN